MSRIFCLSGVVLLGFALVLSFLVSVSLPYLPALDITRVRFSNVTVSMSGAPTIQEIRVSICSPNVQIIIIAGHFPFVVSYLVGSKDALKVFPSRDTKRDAFEGSIAHTALNAIDFA